MIRYLISALLIGISVTVFFVFIDPLYKDISNTKAEVASYNEALDNSKALENERDKLTAKYSAISPENLEKIKKLLPDNVDNIRLILEIEKVALPYGMVLRDVQYNPVKKETASATSTDEGGIILGGGDVDDQLLNKDYGSWDLKFTTAGTYNNFINFTKDLESNLRIVDVSSIQFSSSSETKLNSFLPETYKFNFTIKTYWLKN